MMNFLPKTGRIGLCCLLLLGGLPLLAQPANDSCFDAESIDVGTTLMGSTTGATMESDIAFGGADCGPNSLAVDDVNDKGVWYSFVAPAEELTIRLESTDFNAELTLLSGACDALTCEAFNNNSPQAGDGEDSEIVITLTEGETYLIYAEAGGGATGDFTLSLCPTVAICKDASVTLDASNTASVSIADVAESCGSLDDLTVSPNSFDCSNLGDNTVTVADATGATVCTATVTVVDETAPTITCTAAPAPIFANDDECLFQGSPGNLSISDNCTEPFSLIENYFDEAGGLLSTLSFPDIFSGPGSGPIGEFRSLPLGRDSIEVIVIDAAGLRDTCSFTIEVLDNTPPEAVCVDVTIQLDENNIASIAGSGDGGGTADVAVTEVSGELTDTDPTFNGVNPFSSVGSCLLSGVITDAFYDEFSFTIDMEDTYTFTLVDDGSVDYVYQLYEGGFNPDDACENLIGLGDDEAGSSDPEIMIELTLVPGDYTLVTSTFGNGITGSYTSQFSSANGGQILVPGDDNGGGIDAESLLIDGGSTDACGGEVMLSASQTEFTCDDLGDNTVTLTVTDAAGNPATCEATVTVQDTTRPEITLLEATVVLDADGNGSLMIGDVATATDNCGGGVTLEADLVFGCSDIPSTTRVVTATDASGNVATAIATITVEFEQPRFACVGELNLTLNDECQGLLQPSMLLRGETACLDAFNFVITVNDADPSNGPIVDGCGRFSYSISSPERPVSTTEGFTGDFASFNWEKETITSNNNQTAEVEITETTLTLSTMAEVFNSLPRFQAMASYTFLEPATVSFDYDFNGVDDGFDDAAIVYNFEGEVVATILDTDEPASGSSTAEVLTGYSLVFSLDDDGFQPFSGTLTSELTITNFSVTRGSLIGLDFATCWGYVNAEDKTPPAIVETPEDVQLLCLDLDDNNVSTLPATVSKCYEVSSATGATISGTMSPQLRARLLAGGTTPLVPTFTDGCTERIEVCVTDAVAFDAEDPQCESVVITRTFTATEIAVCPNAAG
ncbi:MAG: hypothetical protein AAGF89_03720, partial [Bacteroidota bacterium]